ncbi:MAG TPA: hypothetical protein VNV42_00450 [Solirubrobacteraceae bacterium]|nr:hypothetical protein [Solirubrobacteraceae bacterium]
MSARPLLGAAVLTLGVGMALPAAADAREEEPKAPEYSLSIVEGESTAPEESVLSTSGSIALPHTKDVPVTVRIAEPDGLTVAQNTHDGGVWLSQVPQVEDYVYLESPAGTPLESVKYDGLPSLDPTVCAGSTNFSGQRTEGEEVEGTADTYVVHPSYTAKRFDGAAQITSLSGSSFGGDFLKPLELGETVSVREHLATALGGGGSFTYSSEDVRPVGACPAPPPPPPPPPPPALAGSLFKLFGSNLHKLLKSGLSDQVTINQAGTVTQDLYEEDGSVPATASTHGKHGAKHKRRKPPALLLARGTVSATTAGTVTVHLRVTAKGRHALSHSHRVRAMLVTTLKTGSGTKLNLPTRSVTLDR